MSFAYRCRHRILGPALAGLVLSLVAPGVLAARTETVRWPLFFEEAPHAGGTRFVVRGIGYGLAVETDGALLCLRRQGGAAARVRMRLLGANADAAMTGLDEQPGRSNYLLGSDPARWRTGVRHHGRVMLRQVYPGVDLVYYGTDGALEYDFQVAPGADPAAIRLAFEGATALRLDEAGDLMVETDSGVLVQHKPVVYQEAGGTRVPVEGGYVLSGSTIGFEIGAYDHDRPLVVDPVLGYSTYLGGDSDEQAFAIAVDPAGNAYVTGATISDNFPVVGSGDQGSAFDAVVVKLGPTGALIYSTYLGGIGLRGDQGNGIAADAAGNAYVTGQTDAPDFPTTAGAYDRVLDPMPSDPDSYDYDAFVTKLGPTGALVYSTFVGTPQRDVANGIALDAAGNAYLAGFTAALDSFNDVLVAKLNAAGSAASYVKAFGGTGNLDIGRAVAVDLQGNVYVTGNTRSPNFPITPGAFQSVSSNAGCQVSCIGQDAFVTKLDTNGDLAYSTFLLGDLDDFGNGIAVDTAGNAYVTGSTKSKDDGLLEGFPTTPGAFQTTYGGGALGDAFVTKLNPLGTGLVYSTYLGGAGQDAGNAIALDVTGAAYVAGFTVSTNFPAPGTLQGFNGSSTYPNVFVTKVLPTGTALEYSTYLGGNNTFAGVGGGDFAFGIAVDRSGNAYVTGTSIADDTATNGDGNPDGGVPFPTTQGAFQRLRKGGVDVFVSKIGNNTVPISTPTATPTLPGQTPTRTRTRTPTRTPGPAQVPAPSGRGPGMLILLLAAAAARARRAPR